MSSIILEILKRSKLTKAIFIVWLIYFPDKMGFDGKNLIIWVMMDIIVALIFTNIILIPIRMAASSKLFLNSKMVFTVIEIGKIAWYLNKIETFGVRLYIEIGRT